MTTVAIPSGRPVPAPLSRCHPSQDCPRPQKDEPRTARDRDLVTDVMATRTRRAVMPALALLAACTGHFDGADPPGPDRPGGATGMVGGSGGSAGAAGKGGAPAAAACQPMADPGPTPLFRLSTLQYRNTVRDSAGLERRRGGGRRGEGAAGRRPDDSTVGLPGPWTNRISADPRGPARFRVATAAADAITGRPERAVRLRGRLRLAAPLARQVPWTTSWPASAAGPCAGQLTADELAGLPGPERRPAPAPREVDPRGDRAAHGSPPPSLNPHSSWKGRRWAGS
jgi:hypothetical protein